MKSETVITIGGVGFILVLLLEALPVKEVTPPTKEVTSPKHYPLPSQCNHLRRTPDPETWDPNTDTYPRNHAWEKCMGVD